MNKSVQANETRQRNQEARTELLKEQTAAIQAARQAAQRVINSPAAAPAQLLEAARLLANLGKR